VNHDRETIERHIERLRAMRDGGRTIPTFAVERTAELLGVSRPTMWRWITNGYPAQSAPYQLTDRVIGLYYDVRGNVSAVARALKGEKDAPSRETLQRAFKEQMSAQERAYVKRGVEGARSKMLYLRYEVDYRNQRWETDHKELPILVVPKRGWKPVKPWVTMFQDAKTRAIMGAALVPRRPTQAEVLAALAAAVTVDPAQGPFGGRPHVIVSDNGLEFTADAVTQVELGLGITLLTTDAYTPTQKGKVERLHRTLEQEPISTLPFYSDGPRAANKQHFGPKSASPMLFDDFAEIFFDYVWEYNNERRHSALDGRTPLEAWSDDPTPISEIDSAQMHWMLPSVQRKVLKDGIHHDKHIFVSSALIGLVGETVEVRYMPYDYRRVEVFRDGKWLCTATPPAEISAAEREEFLKQRRKAQQQMAGRMRASSRRSRARLIALTKPGEIQDGDPIAAAEEERIAKRRQRKLTKQDLKAIGIDGLYEVEEDKTEEDDTDIQSDKEAA
jgi:putative transposase